MNPNALHTDIPTDALTNATIADPNASDTDIPINATITNLVFTQMLSLHVQSQMPLSLTFHQIPPLLN